MRILKTLMCVFFISVLVTSCSDDTDEQFQGDVTVTLVSKGSKEGVEGEAKDFVFDVFLSKSFNQEIDLTFSLKDIDAFPNLLSVSKVQIQKNETQGTLTISSLEKADIDNILSDVKNFEITLNSFSGISNQITLASVEVITIKPEEGFLPLTDEQRELVEHYKTQGIDLTPWIGKIPVEVTVKTGANGLFSPFEVEQNLTYTGTTHITLSENATREKPLLKMTKNAFGLAEYLQYVFRNETILNVDYWVNNPSPTAVLNHLGMVRVDKWKAKEYSFDVAVDNILVNSDNTITYVYENGAFDNPHKEGDPVGLQDDSDWFITAVNFEYDFELWNELLEEIKGDLTFYDENILTGGSIHPDFYIGYSRIDQDDWFETNWVAATGSYDNASKEMNFKFNTDHSNSGDYDIVTVKYKVQ